MSQADSHVHMESSFHMDIFRHFFDTLLQKWYSAITVSTWPAVSYFYNDGMKTAVAFFK